MNFEQTRVTLEPRSVANCLDLALLFSGRHLGPLLGVWTLFAVQLGLATYLAARWTNWGFLCAAVFGFLGSAPLGVMLACGAARTTFGEDFTFRKLLSDLTTGASLVGRILALRIASGVAYAACLMPGRFLASCWGFLVVTQLGRKVR